MAYSGMCVKCKKVNTTSRDEENNFLCASCSNSQYFSRLANDTYREIVLDMRYLKESTYHLILEMIKKDKESLNQE